MLPEEVLGQALLYLIAAVGRQVVFRDPGRFGAALYDEAWALLASPHGQKLVVEGVRDGRKHNGGIWLASQHPNDMSIPDLQDLLGARVVFNQSRGAIDAALRFLGVNGSVDAAATLEAGLGEGQCLYRDVRGRTGLVQVTEPAMPQLRAAFDTTPSADAVSAPRPAPQRGEVRPEPDVMAQGTVKPAALELVAVVEGEPTTTAATTIAERPPQRGLATEGQAAATAARNRARRRRRTPLAAALAQRDGDR